MTLFGPAVVAAVVSTLVVRFVLGDEPVYKIAPFRVESLVEYVVDRPAHDRRYRVDASKLLGLGWQPRWSFEDGLAETVRDAIHAFDERGVAACNRVTR